MNRSFKNIYRLGLKELNSLRRDPVLIFLIIFTFTFAIYTVATGVQTELRNASIAIVDEDHSELSRQIQASFLKPYFKQPALIGLDEIDRSMDASRYAFVIDIPPRFQADIMAQRKPTLQVNVDATAMTLAGNGAAYIQTIINREIGEFVSKSGPGIKPAVTISMRTRFNPNLESSWFMAVMQVVSNITMLSLILSGAAVIRERERGTIEHLLVMPVTPGEIMLAKIWANGLAIILAVTLSLYVVVQGVLAVHISGSIPLFVLGTSLFLYAMTALGIVLSTFAKSMPQFALLEHAFRRHIATRGNAEISANHHAGLTLNPLYQLCPVCLVSRGWCGCCLASNVDNAGHRHCIVPDCPCTFSFNNVRFKLKGIVIYGRPLESRDFFDLRQGGFAVIYPASVCSIIFAASSDGIQRSITATMGEANLLCRHQVALGFSES